MLHRIAEISSRPFDQNFFMYCTLLEMAGFFFKETEAVVRIPSSVADPLA
jgi:hypothetical protein